MKQLSHHGETIDIQLTITRRGDHKLGFHQFEKHVEEVLHHFQMLLKAQLEEELASPRLSENQPERSHTGFQSNRTICVESNCPACKELKVNGSDLKEAGNPLRNHIHKTQWTKRMAVDHVQTCQSI